MSATRLVCLQFIIVQLLDIFTVVSFIIVNIFLTFCFTYVLYIVLKLA